MVAVRAVGVFCGSSSGRGDTYLDAARTLGHLLAQEGVGLVYGGGTVGLMGAAADACLASGGQVIGVIPRGRASAADALDLLRATWPEHVEKWITDEDR